MTEYLARLRPGPKAAKRYNILGKMFYAERGWYKVSEALARQLAKVPSNVLNPSGGPLVFEVKTKDEARQVEIAERAKIAPAGTVDEPNMANADDTAGDMSSDIFGSKEAPPADAESAEDEDIDEEPPEHDAAEEEPENGAQAEGEGSEEEPPEPTPEPTPEPKPRRRRGGRKKVAKKTAKKS